MSQPYLSISHLSLETTRRCSMACKHCLRKKAQNMDLLEKTIDALFQNNIYNIGSVTFSGGEPSLNLDIIRYFYEAAEKHDAYPHSFYVVTNGKENQMELAALFLTEYEKADEKEMCGIALSQDGFHDSTEQSELVKGLAFYCKDKERDPYDDQWVMQTGNAAVNGIGHPRCYEPTRFCVDSYDYFDRKIIEIEDCYLSANGFLYPDCDLSYDVMDMVFQSPDDCPVESVSVKNVLKYFSQRGEE